MSTKTHNQGDWISGDRHVCRLPRYRGPSNFKFRILKNERLSDIIVRLTVHAPLVAANARPGQFVLIRPAEHSERIPLTISHADLEAGSISVIFQEMGATTRELGSMKPRDHIRDLVGPLGTPSEIEYFGTAACVGGGVGIAVMLPVTRALQQAGNKMIGILGARTKDLVLLADEMEAATDELVVITDDGSSGRKGLVTDALAEVIEREKVDICYAIGPTPMMNAVCELTKGHGIKTVVSLDPVMVDGTGMCGGCRVLVGGEAKFTCVDGPEFDGHLVDWATLRARKSIYRDEERAAMQEASNGRG